MRHAVALVLFMILMAVSAALLWLRLSLPYRVFVGQADTPQERKQKRLVLIFSFSFFALLGILWVLTKAS